MRNDSSKLHTLINQDEIDLSHVRKRTRSVPANTVISKPEIEQPPAADTDPMPVNGGGPERRVIKTKHGKKEVNYQTGYGLPPKSGQFQPGQSGNKKGRPKQSRNLRSVMEDIYHRTTEIRRNGKTVKMPLFQVILEQDAMKAASGEAKAIMRVRNDLLKLMGFDDASLQKGSAAETAEGRAVVLTDGQTRLLSHMRRMQYQEMGFSDEDIDDLLKLDFGPAVLPANAEESTPPSTPATEQSGPDTVDDDRLDNDDEII
ncbi:DUF5681 domain-containing protein [Rhizobium sp. Root482]|uniref:DUF5681 domain-containing protein n=1 Tax=Rhizobium sp. Root482 TaxID=1736543 RepID=UPI0006F7B7AB|nr:DUF5681 domain-containing protein [Rhizobium sp. Root482]KQY11202.1 hypothetical protein ASD31_17555 [Rhizobium sp. Root482]